MKVLRLFSILALVAISVSACTNPKEQEKKELEKKVMAVHDEVMPEMGTIQSLQKSLEKMIEEEVQDTAGMDSALIAAAKSQHSKLEEAHNAMMDWMAGYTPPTAEQSVDDAVSYLREQEKSVRSMAETMKTAIADAKAFVEENGVEVEESNEEAHNHDSHNHHEGHDH